MMNGKFALIIGNTEYTDPGLAQLTAPGKDVEDFARVLRSPELCGFDEVKVLFNEPEYVVRGAVEDFFDLKKPDDLLVLYFSGHGVRDELGVLYLAFKNTNRFRLRSTAIKSEFIREAMDQSRSKRQVLILDCCNSGAFAQGTKAATGVSIGTATAFDAGYGRIILTASDSTQFAWEGNNIIGETDKSLFTHFLVKGLEGDADADGDGQITVDELYDYAYEKIRLATPKQTPSKFSNKQQGEIVLRQITRIEDIRPLSLADDLVEATKDPRTFVREGAVRELEKVLNGKNLGLARSAREALERIEREDDSRRVSQAATQALESLRQVERTEERKVLEKTDTPGTEKEQLTPEIARADETSERKSEVVSLAVQEPTKTRTMISQRVLFTGIFITLVIGLTIWGSSYALRNMGAVSTPTLAATENQLVDLSTERAFSANNTNTVTFEAPLEVLDITPGPVTPTSMTTDVFIAVNRAYLYKGPALAHGLAVQKAYPKGEIFTVVARDASGLWLLGRASDGNEGWLYVAWVDPSIDLVMISTASIIPTMPLTPTRRSNEPNCNPPPDCGGGGGYDPVNCICL